MKLSNGIYPMIFGQIQWEVISCGAQYITKSAYFLSGACHSFDRYLDTKNNHYLYGMWTEQWM